MPTTIKDCPNFFERLALGYVTRETLDLVWSMCTPMTISIPHLVEYHNKDNLKYAGAGLHYEGYWNRRKQWHESTRMADAEEG